MLARVLIVYIKSCLITTYRERGKIEISYLDGVGCWLLVGFVIPVKLGDDHQLDDHFLSVI